MLFVAAVAATVASVVVKLQVVTKLVCLATLAKPRKTPEEGSLFIIFCYDGGGHRGG